MINLEKTAFVFPGQGSQSVGMLKDAAAAFPEVKHTFEEASSVLGYDLWALSQEGPAEKLDSTIHTQPALLAAAYALWRVIQTKAPLQPAMLAGHSLGEYTALVCANALSFTDAIQLVAARGQYMQEAVASGAGAMAAVIGLDDVAVTTLCQQAIASSNEVLSPANFNSVGQVVIAGHKPAVERAVAMAKEQGAKLAVMLPVSVPSHCALMKPAAERLATLLASLPLQTPTLSVVNNVDVTCYDDVASIRDGLIRQLFMPVRWVDTIDAFKQAGITTIIECGPGKVLTGLNKRIDKRLQLMTLSDVESLQALLAEAEM